MLPASCHPMQVTLMKAHSLKVTAVTLPLHPPLIPREPSSCLRLVSVEETEEEDSTGGHQVP